MISNALQSLLTKYCLSVNNLCGKLVSSLEWPIAFDELFSSYFRTIFIELRIRQFYLQTVILSHFRRMLYQSKIYLHYSDFFISFLWKIWNCFFCFFCDEKNCCISSSVEIVIKKLIWCIVFGSALSACFLIESIVIILQFFFNNDNLANNHLCHHLLGQLQSFQMLLYVLASCFSGWSKAFLTSIMTF